MVESRGVFSESTGLKLAANSVRACAPRAASWWRLGLLLMIGLGFIAGPPVIGEAKPIDEVKAAFIYKFANFVEWPEGTFADRDEPIQIAVLAEEEFVETIRAVVEGKTVAGRPVEVSRAHDAASLQDCEIAFFGDTQDDAQEALISALQSRAVLTIGDAADFAEEGGIIRLFEEDKRLRFEINLDAAKQADLRISSKLLDLASAVFGNANLDNE